VLNIFFPEEMG